MESRAAAWRNGIASGSVAEWNHGIASGSVAEWNRERQRGGIFKKIVTSKKNIS